MLHRAEVTSGRSWMMASPWLEGLALLAAASAVWPTLALPAAFVAFLGLLALPRRGQPGARWQRGLVAVACGGAAIGLFRFVVEEAMPGIVRGGRRAAEQRAVSRLRDVLFAQDAMRKAAWIDPDRDGVGSAAFLSELCGGGPLRGQPPRPSPVLSCGQLVETPLGPAAQIGGYSYVVCLPGVDGRWSASSDLAVDEEAAERRFAAYAWPDSRGQFDRAFFLDQDENIRSAPWPLPAAAPGEGAGSPELSCEAALRPGSRTDWEPWRGKLPRPGPLPGAQ